MQKSVQKSVEILKKGGVILYPTDTVWGIGCDATDDIAVKKIFHIKQRNESKSLIVLVDSETMLRRYITDIPLPVLDFLRKAEVPTTVIYQNPQGLARSVIAQDGTVAIRIVKDVFCQKLIAKLGKPLVSTSANLSGASTPACFTQIDSRIITQADYVVNYRQNDTKSCQPSRLVRFTLEGDFEILR